VGFGAAGMGRVAPQQHNARGIRSPAYEPGPDSEVHEGGAVRLSIGARASSSPRLAEGRKPPIRSVA
jgi:Rieske 2Fe-2S family protein